MKNFAYIILFLLLPLDSFAQGGYKLTGTVQDAEGKPVPFATVSLWITGQTAPYKGASSNENGAYVLEQIAQGTYTLKAEMVGYGTKEQAIEFNAQTLPATVQNVGLSADTKQLKEVVVEGQRDFIQNTPDATIVRPDANPTTQGGTVTDVLQQTPNVQVDANGNISMRGGRPNVLINGRTSGFGDMRRGGGMNPLDQINAEDVESISISTNPSARFDAEGGGGVIDVRLKRDRQLGTHGMFGVNVGVPRGRVMGNFRVNHRTKKWNVFLGYGGRIDNRLGDGELERKTLGRDQNLLQWLDQDQSTANHNVNHNIRLGGEHYFNERTTLGLEASYGLRSGRTDDLTTSNFINNFTTNAIDSLTRQMSQNISDSKTLEYSLIFQHKFKKEKRELTASFSHIFADDLSNNDLAIQHLRTDFTPTQNATQRKNFSGNGNVVMTFQMDYATPHGKKGVFETGVKITNRDLNTDSQIDNFDVVSNAWVRDAMVSNTFDFTENVQASYLAYRNSLKKWDYSVGVRLENVIMTGKVVAVENTNFRKEFLNLFPTARLAYNINQDQFIKISFARRISRPNFGDLNPFVDISNPLVYRKGNPDINPEFMYNFELGYNRIWDKFTLSPTVFYRLRTDVVQRITLLNAETGISTSTPENIGEGNSYGIELSGSAKFTKWWDMMLSYTFSQNEIMAEQASRGINSSVQTSNVRLNSTFTFWTNARLSFMMMYNAPNAIAQGSTLPMFSTGMGFQKPLDEKRKATIGINVRDMFYTMRFGSETQGMNFTQSTFIRRDTRTVMVNFRYRF